MSMHSKLITGILSIAATAIIAAPNGFAADMSAKSDRSMELKPKAVMQETLDVKNLDEEVSHLEVVDSKGNAYLLIPLKTAEGRSPVMPQDGKITVEYVHPYTGRLGN